MRRSIATALVLLSLGGCAGQRIEPAEINHGLLRRIAQEFKAEGGLGLVKHFERAKEAEEPETESAQETLDHASQTGIGELKRSSNVVILGEYLGRLTLRPPIREAYLEFTSDKEKLRDTSAKCRIALEELLDELELGPRLEEEGLTAVTYTLRKEKLYHSIELPLREDEQQLRQAIGGYNACLTEMQTVDTEVEASLSHYIGLIATVSEELRRLDDNTTEEQWMLLETGLRAYANAQLEGLLLHDRRIFDIYEEKETMRLSIPAEISMTQNTRRGELLHFGASLGSDEIARLQSAAWPTREQTEGAWKEQMIGRHPCQVTIRHGDAYTVIGTCGEEEAHTLT